MRNPYLPQAPPDLGPGHTRKHRSECGQAFYQACLELSQAFWLQQKPAQAILQLNKAAFVPSQPCPYPALVWFLQNQKPGLFIGNPVRHFQHLASRMSGDHSVLRAWRAWACFHLAEGTLPSSDFPRDHDQIAKEDLIIPDFAAVEKNLPTCDASRLSEALTLVNKPSAERP